jgi:hypothetical protein
VGGVEGEDIFWKSPHYRACQSRKWFCCELSLLMMTAKVGYFP